MPPASGAAGPRRAPPGLRESTQAAQPAGSHEGPEESQPGQCGQGLQALDLTLGTPCFDFCHGPLLCVNLCRGGGLSP